MWPAQSHSGMTVDLRAGRPLLEGKKKTNLLPKFSCLVTSISGAQECGLRVLIGERLTQISSSWL